MHSGLPHFPAEEAAIKRLTIRNADPRLDDRPRRIGRAGLAALMDDPRYWDGDHPEHDAAVDTVRRGFEVVFAPPRNPVFTTVPINENAPVTDPDSPFARHFARLVGEDEDLDVLSESRRRALGREVVLATLAEDEDDEDQPARQAEGERSKDKNNFDYDRPWLPVDEHGKEIPPHPDDPRFDGNGNPKEEWVRDGGTKAWALRNSRWNPETGEFEYYADLSDYSRDPDTGRWTKRTPADEKDDDGTGEKGGTRRYPDTLPPTPPVGESPRTRRGRLAFGQWLLELGIWGDQQRQK
ncbi:MAG: hypothetical protein RL477_2336 [Pseudomonadota bacterium]